MTRTPPADGPLPRSSPLSQGPVTEVAGLAGLFGLLVVLDRLGLAGREPRWLLLTLSTMFMLARVPRINTALSAGDPRSRLWLRMGIH